MRLPSQIRGEIQVMQKRIDYFTIENSDWTSPMHKQIKNVYQHEINGYKLRAENLYSDIDDTYCDACKEQFHFLGGLKICSDIVIRNSICDCL